MNEIAAVLLAAGRSRRMGRFKPLLPFGDSTVIECCINNLRRAGIEEIIVVTGHRSAEVQSHLMSYSLKLAANPNPESEMSASISVGVKEVSSSAGAVLIALVDYPAVSSTTIAQIIAEWRRTGARLVQPEYQSRGGHPVLIDLVYRQELIDLPAAAGLRSLFAAHREEVRRFAVASSFVARDMDTWEDYVRIHTELFGIAPRES